MEEKLSLRVRLRRWWKSKKESARWSGWWAEFRPKFIHDIRIAIKNIIWPHNVIRIASLGRSYNERDQVLIHGAFQVLCDFVEREWKSSRYFGHLFDLEDEAYKLWVEALTWEDKERAKEYVSGSLLSLFDQNESTAEIWHLYVWWKYIRPNHEDPLDADDVHAPESVWNVYKVDEDGDPELYTWDEDESDPEKNAKWDAACEASRKFEADFNKEDEEMFIRLVKVRKHLWT